MNEEMLHAYLDGELSPDERARADAALASDAELAAALDRLRLVHRSLELLPGMATSIEGEAILRRARRGRTGRLLRLVAPLAAAAAALALVWRPVPEEPPSREAVFTVEEQVQYLYWESDAETYGSGDLHALESDIVAELEPS